MKLKLSGHETFYPRQNWLQKGLEDIRYAQNESKSNVTELKKYPTDSMGVGINMVKSIRFWLSAFGLVEKKDNQDTQTKFASQLLFYDGYLSRQETNWILHYNLITNGNGPTTWHWFFCHSDLFSFDKQIFMRSYKDWIKAKFQQTYSDRSVENDFQTLIGMYVFDGSKKDLFYPSPFLQLNLLQNNAYQKRYVRVQNPEIDVHVLLYAFLLFKEKYYFDTDNLDLDLLKNFPESPLRAYRMDIDTFFERFQMIGTSIRKKVTISRTAGMKTLIFHGLKQSELLEEIYSKSHSLQIV